MKPLAIATAVLSFAATALCADKSNLTKPLTSKNVLPSTFKPPQVFKNINLVHVINLEKNYPKESINVVIENPTLTPQDEYFISFTAEQMEKIGGLEVRDRKAPELGTFAVEPVKIDGNR
jgi:oligosaccharyltransferase complex subunit alpha (ribophorin I)